MLVSYKWLQSYFEEKLPVPEKLSDVLTFLAFEVEGIEKKGDDTIFDLKVLPDRACYALSHRGMAYEISAATGFKRKIFAWPQPTVSKTRPLEVKVEAPELCSRYVARVIENVTTKSLPWVKEHLEAVGQRSINPIVDGANIVMFDMGQPLHAFDADKVEGGIVVRMARKGEKITTLDNREVILDEKREEKKEEVVVEEEEEEREKEKEGEREGGGDGKEHWGSR
jgi:phenylalanyl-tRNA synthetase beta chain